MTLRHLNIFIGVCELLNMTKTAEKLNMTQPAVSQAVAELEDFYSVKLFERLGKKIYLTSAGEKLLNYAIHAVNFSKEMQEKMKEFSSSFSVKIGASITVGSCVLIPLLQELNKRYSDNRVFSIVDNTTKLEKMLLEDKIDIALVEGIVKSEYLTIKEFMEDELVLVVAAQHMFAKLDYVDKEMLAQEKFFLREQGSGTRDLFEKVMAENEASWTLAGEFNNSEAIKQAVYKGLGVTVISRRAVCKELKEGLLKIVDISQFDFKRKFKIVYHKNKFLSEALQEIILIAEKIEKLKL